MVEDDRQVRDDMLDRALTFAPLAWLKIITMLHRGDTEIGGFGVSRGADMLYVDDFYTVGQECNPAFVKFDDASVAEFFDDRVDEGLEPRQFCRIWIHTHPGSSPNPSCTDEATFEDAFGKADSSVMFIMSRTHATYARLAVRAGPGLSAVIPVRVDWKRWVPDLAALGEAGIGRLAASWFEEYDANVRAEPDRWRSSAGYRNRRGDRRRESRRNAGSDRIGVEWSEEQAETWQQAYMEMLDEEAIVNAFEQGGTVVQGATGIQVLDAEGKPVRQIDDVEAENIVRNAAVNAGWDPEDEDEDEDEDDELAYDAFTGGYRLSDHDERENWEYPKQASSGGGGGFLPAGSKAKRDDPA